MICASCGAETESEERCGACADPVLLDGRYRLEAMLGQGAFGVTYRGVRLEDGLPVCIKELVYRKIGSFGVEERFRKEARILRQLSHPAIPAYVDELVGESGKALTLYVVQELVVGRSLAQELDVRRYREAEVLAILGELLDVLEYLHGLSPPVVHRDLKPANVMRRESGRLVLVDFGSVKESLREGEGSTSAGTYGYMAPEQFHGKASPASDLYSLGALAIALLSRRDPAELVDASHRLQWNDAVQVGAGSERLLAALLEPEPARRPRSIAEARRLLEEARGQEPRAEREPAAAGGSIAESAPRSRKVVLLGFGAAVVFVGLLAVTLPREKPANAPHGLVGVTFGMSPAGVREQIAGLESKTHHGVPELDSGVTVLEGKTLLFDEPATCTFSFAVTQTLSEITCAIDRLPADDLHHQTKLRIVSTARRLWGEPSEWATSNDYERWVWKGAQAELRIDSLHSYRQEWRLRITNTSKEHVAASAAIERDRIERRRAAEKQRQLEEEAKRERERERLRAERELERRRLTPDASRP
jgi:hypothetical protein